MQLNHSCVTETPKYINISEDLSRIEKPLCSEFGFSIEIRNCTHLFRQIITEISDYFLNCTDGVVESVAIYKKYEPKIKFINIDIGLDGIDLLIKSLHNLAKKFSKFFDSPLPPNINFILYFERCDVLKEQVKQLLSSCSNIQVFHDSTSFLGYETKMDKASMVPITTALYDASRFYAVVNNVSDPNFCLKQRTHNSSISTLQNPLEVENASFNSITLLGLFSFFAGVAILVNSLYSYFITKSECNTTDAFFPETPFPIEAEYLGEHQDSE